MLAYVTFAAPVGLFAASWVWFFRHGSAVRKVRRGIFAGGIAASTVAYIATFLLDWYLRRAHLGFWPEAHAVFDVGAVMFISALVGLSATCFGKSYGRVTACIGSLFVALLWWFRAMAAF